LRLPERAEINRLDTYQVVGSALQYAENLWRLSVQRKMEEPVPANKFVLKHHEIEVEYTIGLTPGVPALIYSNGTTKKFTSAEVTTDETALGSLVSVPLLRTTDIGGERFGFFLPQLNVPSGESEEFTTVGVYERFSGPDSVPQRPSSWRCIELHGTAQTVIVEL
jgi:hypothetical protein